MTVQDAVQVVVGDELRQFPLSRALDFVAPFAQFRLDEGQAECAIDVRLLGGYHAAALVQPVGFEPHSILLREGPKLFKMFWRTGRMEEGGSEVLAVGDVNLKVRRIQRRRLLPGTRLLGHQGEIGDELATA